ncbi:MAG TPA: TetR family transcriptional regulator [Solirubrobacteraceae bacterium]|jgi:AcrR family transcriptional regulator
MIAATIGLIGEIGYPATTVEKIIRRARVSRATFYQAFANRDECFLVVFDETLSQLMASAQDAYADAPCWVEGVRAALGCLLEVMDEQPALARLWIIEALRGEERILARRVQTLDALASVIDEGRRSIARADLGPPAGTADSIVGGLVALLHRRLLRNPGEPLSDLRGSMMYMVVLPYLGVRAARAELLREPVLRRRVHRQAPGGADHLEGVDLRLTYRTVRVLDAISSNPGASNRTIAESSGVTDQGQISKLLGRLAGLELIENHGVGQRSGGANAWELSERGRRVANATRLRMGRLA